MKHNHLLLRLVVLMAALMCALGAAAAEAYACYTSSNTTLTFYYDNQRASRTGTTYDLNEGDNDTEWETDGTNYDVTQVVFDPSFAGARPTTTYDWFYGMWNLESITGMSYLNTSEVTNMNWMFMECCKLTSLDVSHFNTSKVTYMKKMFADCEKLTSLDLSSFNTANVTNMAGMFDGCSALTSLDVSHFNTAKVIYMSQMFQGCTGLTSLDLSSFNTSKVTDMRYMFAGSSNLRTIYVGSGWSTAAVTNSTNMFNNCTSLVGGQGTTYNASHVDKTYAHIDGGTSNPGYFTDKNAPVAYACYSPSNTTLTFYCDSQRSSRPGTTYDLNTGENYPGWYTDGTNADVTQVVFDPSFSDALPVSTHAWFRDMRILTSITNIENLNTSSVTNMGRMFMNCNYLTSIDVSHFDTNNVTNMQNMFFNCYRLTDIDLSKFNTSLVTNMRAMFQDCMSITSMDLSSFNTANVNDMRSMFSGCDGLTSLDLTSFNTANVTRTGSMFSYSNALTTIYVGSGWSTAAVTSSSDMFFNCTSLVGGQGTAYSSSNPTDKTYAHIDGGPSNPGYFTDKIGGYTRGDVNGDGSVNISDVTALIDYLLSGNASGINLSGADCNQDSSVNISDVTSLIDYLLAGNWPSKVMRTSTGVNAVGGPHFVDSENIVLEKPQRKRH